MRALLSSIVLFLYGLTCVGGTIYMHQCHESASITLQHEAGSTERGCPTCASDSKNEKKSQTSTCETALGIDCCQDITIDFDSEQELVESTPSPFNSKTWSPATFSIIWMLVFQPHSNPQQTNILPDSRKFVTRSAPTYLLHCNFRI